MTGRCRLGIDCNRPLRHAVEIRHESFVDRSVSSRSCAATASRSSSPTPPANGRIYEDVTADFMYIRLHGDAELYVSGYTDEALERWAARIRAWADGGEPDDAKRISTKPAPRARARATSTATSTTT